MMNNHAKYKKNHTNQWLGDKARSEDEKFVNSLLRAGAKLPPSEEVYALINEMAVSEWPGNMDGEYFHLYSRIMYGLELLAGMCIIKEHQ